MTLVTVSEAALQAIRGRSTTKYPSTRNSLHSNSKHAVSFQQRVLITLFLLCLMVVGVASLFGVFTSDQDLQELRLEFKRDIDSLRTEVERDLVPYLLATAEMQHKKTAALQHVETIVDDPSDPTLHTANPTQANAALAPWEYVRVTFLHYAHAIFDVFVGCKSCAQHATIHREPDAIHEPFSFMEWIPDPGLVYTLEYIKQKRIEFLIAYAFVIWILCKIFRYNPLPDGCNGKTNNKKANGSSKSPRKGKASDDCSENATNGEDDVMNHMFHDAMATAGWPVVDSPAYNRSSNRTNTANRSPVIANNGMKMSKEERRLRARENAMKFAARDKQRLERRGAPPAPPAPSPARKVVSSPAPARSARVSKGAIGREPESSRTEIFSPRASKKDRLKQARANAKLYAQHDKERIRKAVEKRNR